MNHDNGLPIDPWATSLMQRARVAQEAIDTVLSRTRQREQLLADGTYRVRCNICNGSVSNPLPVAVIVRAWVECPACIQRRHEDASS